MPRGPQLQDPAPDGPSHPTSRHPTCGTSSTALSLLGGGCSSWRMLCTTLDIPKLHRRTKAVIRFDQRGPNCCEGPRNSFFGNRKSPSSSLCCYFHDMDSFRLSTCAGITYNLNTMIPVEVSRGDPPVPRRQGGGRVHASSLRAGQAAEGEPGWVGSWRQLW